MILFFFLCLVNIKICITLDELYFSYNFLYFITHLSYTFRLQVVSYSIS